MYKVVKGVNDLESQYPELVKEWNYELNGDLKPSEVSPGSKKEVWWNCLKEGHPYKAMILNRVHKHGCPFCAGKKVLKGFNDLATCYPNIAAEWDYDRNELKPDETLATSHKKAWFICNKGHHYETNICIRTSRKCGCPVCDRERKTSFPEQALYYYIKKYFPDTLNGDKKTIGMELDIYIPSLKTAVEYDGFVWHSKEKVAKNEVIKNQLCEKNNITLIRIREAGLSMYDNCVCFERIDNKRSTLDKTICNVLNFLGIEFPVVNCDKNNSDILGSYVSRESEKSLAVLYPEIAKEWNYELNGNLKPEQVSAHSGKKAWFTCEKGHNFFSIINLRSSEGQNCPICAGKQVLKGFNDLATTRPNIAAEWDYDKNEILPTEVTFGSNKKVWWKCSKGHSYYSRISNKTISNRGCPECSVLKIRPVIVCIENGKVYKNTTEAGDDLGFYDDKGRVSNCAKGKTKTAFGYHWRLATDEEKASIGLVETANKKTPKKIEFDSNRSDAYNKMAIDKISQAMMPGEGMEASVMA